MRFEKYDKSYLGGKKGGQGGGTLYTHKCDIGLTALSVKQVRKQRQESESSWELGAAGRSPR
jgi:hypothetical protein